MTTYYRNPTSIAAALRAIADQLDALGPVELPGTAVGVNLQVCAWDQTSPTTRAAAVDALCMAVYGQPGQLKQTSTGPWFHSATFEQITSRPDGVQVDIYAGDMPTPTTVGGAR